MTNFHTVAEAAELSGLNPRSVRYAIDVGHLKATNYGKTWLISEDDLQDWLNDDSAHKRGRKAGSKQK